MENISEKQLQWFSSLDEIADAGFDYDSDYFVIVKNVALKKLISLLSCGNGPMLMDRLPWPENFQKQKCEALEVAIRLGKKIIPPIIGYENKGLFISDGRHRIKIAMMRKEINIPILLSKQDFSAVYCTSDLLPQTTCLISPIIITVDRI